MKFVALTIFPELMDAFWGNGMMRRAAADGDAGRIITAIFEAPQAFHQDRYDVAFSDGSYDATHGELSPA